MFFALWPGEDQRRGLADLAARCAAQSGGKAVVRDNIHLTLAFLGEIGAELAVDVAALAGTLVLAPFTFRLNRLGFWRRNGIVWVGCERSPAPLAGLVADLQSGLARLGVRVETRPYVPHLTLVRRGRRAPDMRMEPVEWPVTEFCLVRSHLSSAGAHYEVTGRWPQHLGGGVGAG